MKKKRKFCPHCGVGISKEKEGDIIREHCRMCNVFFYDNPLPVVSAILERERHVLLVKRKNEPYQGMWCLPSGFAEIGESIEEAALRELEEETGVKAEIVGLVDADSCENYFYGDLIFTTFEVEQVGGVHRPGDDAIDVEYFPIDKMPELAFTSNTKAVESYIRLKKDFWAITDSFTLATKEEDAEKKDFLSDRLVEFVEEHSERICKLWLEEVMTHKSTASYHHFDPDRLFQRAYRVVSHFGRWLEGGYGNKDIREVYTNLGRERKAEGFALSDVMSALSITKKHIWEFALSRGVWHTTMDIYMALELDRRISLFFDRATFYVAVGYEDGE